MPLKLHTFALLISRNYQISQICFFADAIKATHDAGAGFASHFSVSVFNE
jgi:hypothetical protein